MNELKNLSLEQLRRIVVIKEEIERLKVEMSCVAREDATAGSHSSFAIPARSHTAGYIKRSTNWALRQAEIGQIYKALIRNDPQG